MGHEFASCCLNQFASADPWSNIRVLILKKGSQPFTLVLDLGSVGVDTPAAYARGFVYRKSSLVSSIQL